VIEHTLEQFYLLMMVLVLTEVLKICPDNVSIPGTQASIAVLHNTHTANSSEFQMVSNT